MADGIQQLAHDHVLLNHRVVTLATLVRGFESNGLEIGSALLTSLNDLREQLFAHFAREEEGLFPFIADVAPDLAERVHAMAVGHDTICGALVRTYHLAATNASSVTIAAVFERFFESYAVHSSAEAALFEDLAVRLDATQRSALASLVDGL